MHSWELARRRCGIFAHLWIVCMYESLGGPQIMRTIHSMNADNGTTRYQTSDRWNASFAEILGIDDFETEEEQNAALAREDSRQFTTAMLLSGVKKSKR